MGVKEVAAGAEWLDKNFPGWEREIDLGRLTLDSCHECVLGQVLREKAHVGNFMNGFHLGLDIARTQAGEDIDNNWALDHGFAAIFSDEKLWRELIKERFSSGLLSDEK